VVAFFRTVALARADNWHLPEFVASLRRLDLLQVTNAGLYCAQGDFYIDPWRPVDFAVITHAHSDHARPGSRFYLTAEPGRLVLKTRLGPDAKVEGLPYGAHVTRNGVKVSLHPAGHILGSTQVRVEYRGEIWVASGDYKVETEKTCVAFEPVKCHTFITESTFGLPIYRWQKQADIFAGMNSWWRENRANGRTSVIFAYSLGKAQRVLSEIDASIGPIFVHGAVARLLPAYAAAGVALPPVQSVTTESVRAAAGGGLVIAPSSTNGSPWLRRFGETSRAAVSGWMQIRGARRRAALDRGFVLSDHADWDGLLSSIRATGATRILVTHGYVAPMVRYLAENGWQTESLPTHFAGEADEDEVEIVE
jgi:putative mRNA 3-end processing factor